ncbi:hypothetical protein [Enterobacter kobei]|uniref:hypothetical protein n=1 Tax=Enterobacter kobei TaxID=208224 RepID=UPI00079BBB7A|nr:hypothetical protein [Enterobacter kobei]SAF45920.1 Uncharacterised protein [Enterobacter kobei]
MSVQIIANDDQEVSSIVAALEASGFTASIVISGCVNTPCTHSPIVGMNCRQCHIAHLLQQYNEQEAQLNRTANKLREAVYADH